ncbi:hypothetical protein V8C42DRAFT_304592 [Trichoderma barbatum]
MDCLKRKFFADSTTRILRFGGSGPDCSIHAFPLVSRGDRVQGRLFSNFSTARRPPDTLTWMVMRQRVYKRH